MVSLVKTIYKKIKGKNNGKSKELHTASPEYSAVFPDQRIFQDGIHHISTVNKFPKFFDKLLHSSFPLLLYSLYKLFLLYNFTVKMTRYNK